MSYIIFHFLPVAGEGREFVDHVATPHGLDFAHAAALYGVGWERAADVETFRRLWPGKLVLKGVMHPDDATRAAAMGVDGVMVSNHGARQLDRAPSPIEVLPAIHAAVGDKMTVMYDSGIRRGSDVIVALCLGAKFVFVGRHTLYGVAAGGVPGASRALGIFRDEVDRALAQMGAPDLKSLGPQFLMWKDLDDLKRNARP